MHMQHYSSVEFNVGFPLELRFLITEGASFGCLAYTLKSEFPVGAMKSNEMVNQASSVGLHLTLCCPTATSRELPRFHVFPVSPC